MAEEHTRDPWLDMASTKEELIGILWRMRADIERFAAEAGPERMEVPGVAGDWSLKDVVAHLNAWRWWSVARMEGAVRNEQPRPSWSADVDEWEEGNVDQINEEFFESARKKSVHEVLRDSRATFDRLEDAIMSLSNEVLFDTKRFAWMEGYSASDIVMGSAGHLFEDHERDINLFLASKRR